MNPASQLALDLLQPLAPSLDNFVAGRNLEAITALRRLLAGELPERIVYIWGAAGCGRSHLAAAAAAAGPGARGWRWSPEAAPEQPGLAVLDDVDRLDPAAQIALFNRLNAVRADVSLGCLITGAAPPVQLVLREDLRTRLAWGLVYQLHALSDQEKAAALATHAAARGVVVAGDVIPYLLTHLPRDMRTLIAVIEALDRFALASKRPLTLPLVREWLK